MSEKRLLQAAVLLVKSLKMINNADMQEIGAVSDLRSYLNGQESVRAVALTFQKLSSPLERHCVTFLSTNCKVICTSNHSGANLAGYRMFQTSRAVSRWLLAKNTADQLTIPQFPGVTMTEKTKGLKLNTPHPRHHRHIGQVG